MPHQCGVVVRKGEVVADLQRITGETIRLPSITCGRIVTGPGQVSDYLGAASPPGASA